MSECERTFNDKQLVALLLVAEMLMVLDPLTFMGSSHYEVPTRSDTIWCGSPIRYDGPISIILKIHLISCLSTQESGLLFLSEVHMPSDFSCYLCQWLFHYRGRGWDFVLSRMGGSPTFVRNKQHNRTCTSSGRLVHIDATVTTHKER